MSTVADMYRIHHGGKVVYTTDSTEAMMAARDGLDVQQVKRPIIPELPDGQRDEPPRGVNDGK